MDHLNALAVALWLQQQRRAEAPVLRGLPSGWRNNPSQAQDISFTCSDTTVRAQYRVHSQDRIDAWVDGTAHTAAILSCDAEHLGLTVDGVQRRFQIFAHGAVYYVHGVLGSSELHEVPRFPPPAREEVRGGCVAPMPGKIVAVMVKPGDEVEKGAPLVILEAMKMEHTIAAPAHGVVKEVHYAAGEQVLEGAELIAFEALE